MHFSFIFAVNFLIGTQWAVTQSILRNGRGRGHCVWLEVNPKNVVQYHIQTSGKLKRYQQKMEKWYYNKVLDFTNATEHFVSLLYCKKGTKCFIRHKTNITPSLLRRIRFLMTSKKEEGSSHYDCNFFCVLRDYSVTGFHVFLRLCIITGWLLY